MTSPVYNVIAVPIEEIQANEYNPNHVAAPEMKLLYQSIKEDGYTMPIVCYKLPNGKYEIVDGFHRYLTMKMHKDIFEREEGKLPVVVIDKDKDRRSFVENLYEIIELNKMYNKIRKDDVSYSDYIEYVKNYINK